MGKRPARKNLRGKRNKQTKKMPLAVIAFSKPLRFVGCLCTHPAAPLRSLGGSWGHWGEGDGELPPSRVRASPGVPAQCLRAPGWPLLPGLWPIGTSAPLQGTPTACPPGSLTPPKKREISAFHLAPAILWQPSSRRAVRSRAAEQRSEHPHSRQHLESPPDGETQTPVSLGQTGKHDFKC